jgi:hypothetical protein
MAGVDESNGSSKGAAQRGLLKLMLKLPAVRGPLQILSGRSTSLSGICEAYDDATDMLEKLQAGRVKGGDSLLDEYRTICSEIEDDVIRRCLEHR